MLCLVLGLVQSKRARIRWLGAGCYARIRCKVKVLGAKVWCCVRCCVGAKQTSKDKVVRVLCGYIYQANAWCGGGRVFEIEFQFQLVLSLVLGLVLSKG